MVPQNSDTRLSAVVTEEVRGLIMERFHAAFMKVGAAMDELEPAATYASSLFGFNLYFTVQWEMLRLDGVLPGLTVASIPNLGGTTAYTLMSLPGIIATFASAGLEDGMPRPSKFRKALQLPLFDTSSYVAGDPLRDPKDVYVQFVYGRTGHELAFVKMVRMTATKVEEEVYIYRVGESEASSDQVEQVTEKNWFGD